MIQELQYTENSNYTAKMGNSDLRAVKLRLLSMATDISYRRVITSECPAIRQIERDKMQMFEEAMETLASIEFSTTPDVPCVINQALRQAYNVYCADSERLDESFHDVSYGCGDTQYRL